MVVSPGRKTVAHHAGDVPVAGALDPGAQDDLGRGHGPGRAVLVQGQAEPVAVRAQSGKAAVVPDGEVQHVAQPKKIVAPHIARDLVEDFPGVGSEPGFVPGAAGQRRNAPVGACQVFRRPQGRHPREGDPGAFLSIRGPVDHQHVLDPLALQAGRNRDAGLAGANHDDVIVSGPGRFCAPGFERIGEGVEIAPHLFPQCLKAPPLPADRYQAP